MNIADRILQHRFSVQRPVYPSDAPPPPAIVQPPPPAPQIAPPAPPTIPPPPAPATNQPVPASYKASQSQPYVPSLTHYNTTSPRSNHFTINHHSPHHKTTHKTRPQSAKFKRTVPFQIEQSKMPLTPPMDPTNFQRKPLSPIHKPPVPPIPIQQSYTPPSLSPNSPYGTHHSYQITTNPLNPSSTSPNGSNGLHTMLHPNVNRSIKTQPQPPPPPHRQGNNQFVVVNTNELPMGWAKLQDEEGIYYFNVMTGVKQRERPQNKEEAVDDDGVVQPAPYGQNLVPISDMSSAEMQYRKNNGSMIFANLISQMSSDHSNAELIRQENWDMLVDAIYLNLSPNDYLQVFKALRSIAENLFDEDDKYRVLYADNKKVQQRILSRIGGYEFLRGLGFRECSKRKLICDTPDFDIVATAITSINAKLTLLERIKPSPIIPHELQAPAQKDECIELDVNVDEYLRKNIDNVLPSPHHQGLHKSLNKQFKQKHGAQSQYHPPPQHNVEIIELELDPTMSDVIKSEITQIINADPIDVECEDEDEKRSHVMFETDDLDIKEGEEGYVEKKTKKKNKAKKCVIVESGVRSARKPSQVTSAYYSDEEDEKLNMVIAPENNMETDAGLCETEEYFKQKRDAFHANASRKRSLSWSERNTLAKEQQKEMEKEKKQHAFIHKKANYYKHRYTLPPKQQAPLIPKSLNDVLRLEQKKKSKSKRRPGARKKAHTHEDVKKGSIQRSSSVHSPPGRGNRKKNFDAPNIESEVNRAYIDTGERKLTLTLQALQMNDDEDIESLFDEDEDMAPPPVMKALTQHKQQSRDDLQIVDDDKSITGAQRSYTWRRNHHFGMNNSNAISNKRNTFSEGNMKRSRSDQRSSNSPFVCSAVSPQSLPSHATRITRMQSQVRHHDDKKVKVKKQKVRSNSFGDGLHMNHMSILLPSEKKSVKRKQNKKIAKQKTANKIRKSVGAIWNAFTSKNHSKDNTYYDAPHNDDKDVIQVVQHNNESHDDEEDVMTPNILNEANRNKVERVELVFEDATVVLDADVTVNCINLISLALEKRGWSATMAHLFELSIKDDNDDSDEEMLVTLEDHDLPIQSRSLIAKQLNMTNPTFVVSYKQND